MPELSEATRVFFRAAYGVLLFMLLAQALPQARRFFLSERFGGYTKSTPTVDRIQSPAMLAAIALVWFASALLLVFGHFTVLAAALNLLLCRYYFVRMRWGGVLRGMGAPGFMTYWLGFAVFAIELSVHHAPTLLPLVLLVVQVDFALIMLSAGIYKFTAGYPQNHGAELGLANPEWGYWWRTFMRVRPDHWAFRTMNHLAWGFEVLAGVLMLIPATRFVGAMLMFGSFGSIAGFIRLGVLSEMVMLGCVLFFQPGTIGDTAIDMLLAPVAAAPVVFVPLLTPFFGAVLIGYLLLLPFAHAGLFYNFYGHRSLPGSLQSALERYTNFFGIIIWRVFSVDVVSFFVRVWAERDTTKERTLISNYGERVGGRFSHVGESIAITSVFTTLKYYPDNPDVFRDRLLRYARTLPNEPGSTLVFEYVAIRKRRDCFAHVSLAEYKVDLATDHIEEIILDEEASVRVPSEHSPVFAGVRPGSYAPAART